VVFVVGMEEGIFPGMRCIGDEEEMEEEAEQTLGLLDKKLCCFLQDENGEVVAFGISFPSISKALQKAKGSMFPFGWIHFLKAIKNYTVLDLMINGAAPKWQHSGVSSVYHCIMAKKYRDCGAKWAIANPQIETNTAVNVWSKYENELYMRRRCYVKSLYPDRPVEPVIMKDKEQEENK